MSFLDWLKRIFGLRGNHPELEMKKEIIDFPKPDKPKIKINWINFRIYNVIYELNPLYSENSNKDIEKIIKIINDFSFSDDSFLISKLILQLTTLVENKELSKSQQEIIEEKYSNLFGYFITDPTRLYFYGGQIPPILVKLMNEACEYGRFKFVEYKLLEVQSIICI